MVAGIPGTKRDQPVRNDSAPVPGVGSTRDPDSPIGQAFWFIHAPSVAEGRARRSGSSKLRNMPLPRVKLVLTTDPRETLIEVDGHDITKTIAGIQVGRVANEPFSHVTLHLRADVELDTDLAEVAVERERPDSPSPSVAAAMRDMLGQVDPGELEQAALAKMNGLDGGPASFGAAVVEVLREWAAD